MTEQPEAQTVQEIEAQTANEKEFIYTVRDLMKRAATTQDERLVKLAQAGIEMVKESSGVESLICMLPDLDEPPAPPYASSRRRR